MVYRDWAPDCPLRLGGRDILGWLRPKRKYTLQQTLVHIWSGWKGLVLYYYKNNILASYSLATPKRHRSKTFVKITAWIRVRGYITMLKGNIFWCKVTGIECGTGWLLGQDIEGRHACWWWYLPQWKWEEPNMKGAGICKSLKSWQLQIELLLVIKYQL